MTDLYDAIGNEADKHRLMLFEPRGLASQWTRPFYAARQLDASQYHRLRMVVRHVLTRIARTVKGDR